MVDRSYLTNFWFECTINGQSDLKGVYKRNIEAEKEREESLCLWLQKSMF